MSEYALETKAQGEENTALQSASVWIIFSSVLVVPVLAFIGFIEGRGSLDIYAKLSDGAYSTFAHLSWLPIVLAALIAETLRLNSGWLREFHRSSTTGEVSQLKLFSSELLLTTALWFCAWWTGTVVGQVWAVRDVMSGIFVVLGICALLAHLYRYVVIEDHDTEHAEILDPSSSLPDLVAPDVGMQSSPELQQTAHQSGDLDGLHDEADTYAPSSSSGRAKVRSKESEYDFPWEKAAAGFDSLAGMQPLKVELRNTIKRFAHYKDMQHCQDVIQGNATRDKKWKIADQNGILLAGPPGNGKTAFATAIAAELGLPFVKLGCGDLTSKWVNESPAVIKELFRQATKQPCVVFFDEFDGVALSRANGNMHGEDRKVVNALLSEIDRARSNWVVLIAATNFADLIDPAISRPGRFDFHIEIPYPDLEARVAIIRTLLDRNGLIVDRVTLDRVAKLWKRRSVAFIDFAVKRIGEAVSTRGDFRVFMEDFKAAARAACRMASAIPGGGPKLSEITLASSVRQDAKSLVYRLRNWEEISERGGETPSGVLLYGPPGTGKTMFVRALAQELVDWHVFEVNASDVGQNAKAFRETVELAQTHRPSIVFIDEADELLAIRTGSWNAGATNEILKCLDGFAGKVPEVLFVAATNRLEAVDPAALRGGRFSEKIFMDLLRGDDLVAFLKKQLQNMAQVRFSDDVNANDIASLIGEASPADVVSLIKKVVNYSFGEDCRTSHISMKDFCAVNAMSVAIVSGEKTRMSVG